MHEVLQPLTGHQALPALARDLALLPLAVGGLGLQSLARRRGCPPLQGAWQACLAGVCSELGLLSLGAFQQACPAAWGQAEGAGRALLVRGTDWLHAAAEPRAKAQRALAAPEQHARRQRLLGALPPNQAAQLRSASGKGAGSWLLPPTEEDHVLADAHYLPALALRLQLPRPAAASATCLRRREDGALCGADLGATPGHCLGCHVGGGTTQRHDGVRDWLAGWLRARGATGVGTEQFVPAWDRARADGSVEAARLDVVYADPAAGVSYVDVVVTDAALGADTPAGRSRAVRDGAAAAAAEERKHRRYPGRALTAFALEALGRAGTEAQALLRTWARGDAAVLAAARQGLAATLQRGNAEAYRSACLAARGATRRQAGGAEPAARRARAS